MLLLPNGEPVSLLWRLLSEPVKLSTADLAVLAREVGLTPARLRADVIRELCNHVLEESD
eukprot:10954112-Prorocentrum_lima.AAC.1